MPSKKAKSGSKGADAVQSRKKRQWLPAAERRAQIIEAAQHVFVRQGLHGTRTRDLADAAGVNEATLFLYFSNKQEIFDAAITEQLIALVDVEMRDGNAFAEAINPKAKERIGVDGVSAIYKVMIELYPLLTSSLFNDRDLGRKTYKKSILPMIEKLRAASKKSFMLKDDESAEFVVLAAFGLCFMLHMHNDLRGAKDNVEGVSRRISNLLLYGLLK